VRDFATNQDRNEAAALQEGVKQKATVFVERSGQSYLKKHCEPDPNSF